MLEIMKKHHIIPLIKWVVVFRITNATKRNLVFVTPPAYASAAPKPAPRYRTGVLCNAVAYQNRLSRALYGTMVGPSHCGPWTKNIGCLEQIKNRVQRKLCTEIWANPYNKQIQPTLLEQSGWFDCYTGSGWAHKVSGFGRIKKANTLTLILFQKKIDFYHLKKTRFVHHDILKNLSI